MNILRKIDLNLLVTLHALLLEKHVSRAALRLHKSQPAVSHALAHLRDIFDDPLLIRRNGKLELTSKANELMLPLTEALERLGALIEQPHFIPLNSYRAFRVAMSDYGARVILPHLVHTLSLQAPNISLDIVQGSRDAMLAGVADGNLDMAFGVFHQPTHQDLRIQPLFHEYFVSAVDKNSLSASTTMDIDEWISRPHVLVAMQSGERNEIEQALIREGLSRQVAVTLPHWSVASQLILGTNLILTAARRSFDGVVNDERVMLFEPPFDIDSFHFDMVWHSRRERDAGHNWLRKLIIEQFMLDQNTI